MSDQTVQTTAEQAARREASIASMVRLFYSKPMAPAAVILWIFAAILVVAIILFAFGLAGAETTGGQIGYAVGIILCAHGLVIAKLVGWMILLKVSLGVRLDRIQEALLEG